MGTKFLCPNLTAFNISSSVKPFVSDSTINTASLVPATTKSNFDSFSCSFEGFKTYLSFIYPTLDAATGPLKGSPEIASAAEDAIIERISASTTGEVAALHRGFSNYTQHKYRNAPMWELPIGLKAELPEVSLFCDPSHICGNTEFLSFVSQKAMDLGMDGLMLETHANPNEALSDASQQITPSELKELITGLEIRSSLKGSITDSDLSALRIKMDSIDEQLMELLSGRMEIAKLMGEFKKVEGLTVLHLERWREIVRTRMKWSKELGLSEEFILRVLEQVHKESIKVQTDVMNQES